MTDRIVLRIYIPHGTKTQPLSWRNFGRRQSLSQYLYHRALESATGDVELHEVLGGYLRATQDLLTRAQRTRPDTLDIIGERDGLNTFVDFYRAYLPPCSVVFLTTSQYLHSSRWS